MILTVQIVSLSISEFFSLLLRPLFLKNLLNISYELSNLLFDMVRLLLLSS